MSDRGTAAFLATVRSSRAGTRRSARARAGPAAADGAGRRGPLAPGDHAAGAGAHRRRHRLGRLQVTGGRETEIGRPGRGEIVGLIGALDGHGHATTVRVTEPATVLALGRLDLAALLAGQQPPAFA